jgi:hypothetical protein
MPGFGVPVGKARKILMIRRPNPIPARLPVQGRPTRGPVALGIGYRERSDRWMKGLEGPGLPWWKRWSITSGYRRCVAPSVDSWRQSSFFRPGSRNCAGRGVRFSRRGIGVGRPFGGAIGVFHIGFVRLRIHFPSALSPTVLPWGWFGSSRVIGVGGSPCPT